MNYDVIVIGAGINGLSTAYHLLRRGVGRLAVLEQFTLGHVRGSSHGFSRITRSTYRSPKYVELVQIAHGEEWPRLSTEAGTELLHPTPGCFFGPGIQPYLSSLEAVPEVLSRIQVLGPDEARQAFPEFLFPDSERVLRDNTCALVAAQETMRFLSQRVAANAHLVENCPVAQVERDSESLKLHTSAGTFTCGRLILTAGPWTSRLLPGYQPKLQVAHQDVGYFAMPGAPDFPVWVYVPAEGDSYYGLPQFGRPGAKVARHRTGPMGDDPNRAIPSEMPREVEADLQAFSRRQFAHPGPCVGYEACLYTNTTDEDFILDFHPEDPRIVVGAGFSGHGFKFGPLTGRILCELLLDGKTSLEVFERNRATFSFAAHQDWPPCPAEA